MTDYACNGHMVDGHKYKSERCEEYIAKGVSSKRNPVTLEQITTKNSNAAPAAAAAAVDQSTSI